jgi:CDP-glucose 4,6-dehydratase
MTPTFWSGKRVFLTGHTGFKGAWLALWLQRMGAVVHGYALPPVHPESLFTQARVEGGMRHQIGEIRDRTSLLDSVRQFAPEVIFHMAAQSLVRRSYEEPADTFAVNVMGTVHVLEAARHVPAVRATVIVSSDKCYANDETGRAFVESDPLGGRDPYSSSKAAAEMVAAAYGRSFFEPGSGLGSVASVRAGNAIGGGDWAEHRILPDIFRGLLADEPIVIRNPSARRPWQHVLEPLGGYLAVAERMLTNAPGPFEAWNFGPDSGNEQTVETVARICCELWGRPNAFRLSDQQSGPHEAGILRLDSTKARHVLNWKPRWALANALKHSTDWYRAFGAGQNMREISLAQIEEFSAS